METNTPDSPTTPFNLTSRIIDFESGEMTDEDAVVEFYQYLVDSGLAWSLQGFYGRTASSLIEAGLVTR